MSLDIHALARLPHGKAREEIEAHERAQMPTHYYRVSVVIEAKGAEEARFNFSQLEPSALIDDDLVKVRRVKRK